LDGEIATKRRGRVQMSRWRSREIDVHITGSYTTAKQPTGSLQHFAVPRFLNRPEFFPIYRMSNMLAPPASRRSTKMIAGNPLSLLVIACKPTTNCYFGIKDDLNPFQPAAFSRGVTRPRDRACCIASLLKCRHQALEPGRNAILVRIQ
jgi:hypothetical protein